MDWVDWLFLYAGSVVTMYGIVHRIQQPCNSDDVCVVVFLTLIWPIWYPFYLSWWIWWLF